MTKTCDGFVDLQVNGCLGIRFTDPALIEAAARKACDHVLASGTAAFLPTVTTHPQATYQHCLPILAKLIDDPVYQGRILGLHLEGPFLSPKPGAVGAHNPDYCQAADVASLQNMQEWANGHIRLLTVAADLEHVDALCRAAVDMGICVSSGHSLAECDDLNHLAKAGATALTHLGNGLPNAINRHFNPIWSGLAHDDYTAMIITDGHHLPPALQKVMIRSKGVDKIVVVSDASSLAGMPAGTYQRGDRTIVMEENGKLHIPERGCLAGSSALMLQCMNQLASLDILDYDDLLRVSIDNPLALIHAKRDDYHSDLCVNYDEAARQFALTAHSLA